MLFKMIRKANINDIESIYKIQEECYPQNLCENTNIFEKIIEQDMSYVYIINEDNQSIVIGYLLAHYSFKDDLVLLNTTVINDKKDCIFIHDLCTTVKRRGVGSKLYKFFEKENKNLNVQLISINETSLKFWLSNLFTPKFIIDNKEILENYGNSPLVIFMEKL